MKTLNEIEIKFVSGGELNLSGDSQNVQDVSANADKAVDVCGSGNVASVTTTGFTCK